MGITLLLLDVCCVIGSIALEHFNITLLWGILLGNIYTLLNFALLGTLVQNAVMREPHSAKRYMRTHYFIRWLLMGVVLSVAFMSPVVNGWCVVVSLFAPKITYTAIGFYQWIFNKRGNNIGH